MSELDEYGIRKDDPNLCGEPYKVLDVITSAKSGVWKVYVIKYSRRCVGIFVQHRIGDDLQWACMMPGYTWVEGTKIPEYVYPLLKKADKKRQEYFELDDTECEAL